MKLPYFRSLAGAVKANLQGGRGGACTSYFSCFDPEANTIIMLQNPRSTRDKQNRDIHFAMMYNRLIVKKAARDEPIFTFNVFTAPDLMDMFFTADQDGFEALYDDYESRDSFKKNYVSARELLISAGLQGHEVSTLYFLQIDEVNRHTSFKDPIHSSNLCLEITQPTVPYQNMQDLYSDTYIGEVTFKDHNDDLITINHKESIDTNRGTIDAYFLRNDDFIYNYNGRLIINVVEILSKTPNSEISLCSLAGIVACNIKSDEEYESASYYSLKMIDKCIHKSSYALPHVGFTTKNRLNAGVGLLGMAYSLAKKDLKYDSKAGLEEIHRIAERHAYFVIKGSLTLGKELGNAPWSDRTKWADGWLPIDTYKKSVDELVEPNYKYDWEGLREAIIENKGIRNSSLIAHMPTESSSKASGIPNCVYPIRDLSMKKTDAKNVLDWCAIDNDLYADQYQLAWEISSEDMIKAYAVIQKFTDQAISADFYKDRSNGQELTTDEILQDFFNMTRYGVKSKYYQNTYTVKVESLDGSSESAVNDRHECVGACSL